MRESRISKIASVIGSKIANQFGQMPSPQPSPIGGAATTMPGSPQPPQPQPLPAAPKKPEATQQPIIIQQPPAPMVAPIINPPSMPAPISGYGINGQKIGTLDARFDFNKTAAEQPVSKTLSEIMSTGSKPRGSLFANLALRLMARPGQSTAISALLGAIPGAAIGAMVPAEDKDGKNNRGRNALIGAGIGGAVGAGVVGGTALAARSRLTPEEIALVDMYPEIRQKLENQARDSLRKEIGI